MIFFLRSLFSVESSDVKKDNKAPALYESGDSFKTRRSETIRRIGRSILSYQFSILHSLFIFLLITICSCTSYRYLNIETLTPADITFPLDMRRILIVNNTLPQDDVPFESSLRQWPATVPISADSTAIDFCRTLGVTLAEFDGFDDIRLLEGHLRKDLSPVSAPVLKREEVELLCEEHETDVVISLDRLIFRLNEYADNPFDIQMREVMHVEISGILRVYVPGRENPMTTIVLTDTLISVLWLDPNNKEVWDLLFSDDPTNLFRESARYMANEARTYFIPYWNEDVRWYFTSSIAQWKEATAYAESKRWDKALNIWRELYGRATSWRQRARLCSNLALGEELTGDLAQALYYAKLSHQLMHDHLGADDTATKKQEVFVNVLTNRITEEQKLRLQMAE